MKTQVSIQDVRKVNNAIKENLSTLGGCISAILTLDKQGLEKQEAAIINYLIRCKKDKVLYQDLANTVKPHHKSGKYGRYAVLLAVRRQINSAAEMAIAA